MHWHYQCEKTEKVSRSKTVTSMKGRSLFAKEDEGPPLRPKEEQSREPWMAFTSWPPPWDLSHGCPMPPCPAHACIMPNGKKVRHSVPQCHTHLLACSRAVWVGAVTLLCAWAAPSLQEEGICTYQSLAYSEQLASELEHLITG